MYWYQVRTPNIWLVILYSGYYEALQKRSSSEHSTIFHRYEMELFEKIFERDVELMHDMFLPQPSDESRGMRVLFK
jgi:hypothetical protein